jgi:flagellar biosynthesis GTPase FlhF
MNDEIRYRGRTPGEAMRKARADLGEDARLVDSRRVPVRGQTPVYEVRVLPPGVHDESMTPVIPAVAEAPSVEPAPLPPKPVEARAAKRWIEVLQQRGAGEEVAQEIVAAAGCDASGRDGWFKALRTVIEDRFGESHPENPPGERSTVFVGPTGAGKTTVASRVASELARRGDAPILVSADGESIAGEDTLQAVGEALELRVETAFLDGQVQALVEELGAEETYLVDTPGRAPFDEDGLVSVRRLVRSLPDPEVLLVMPATTDMDEARLLVRGYSMVGVDRVVLTKLDELCRPGRILDLAIAVDKPIALVTFGRGVHGTSSAPTDVRIVSRILGPSFSVS